MDSGERLNIYPLAKYFPDAWKTSVGPKNPHIAFRRVGSGRHNQTLANAPSRRLLIPREDLFVSAAFMLSNKSDAIIPAGNSQNVNFLQGNVGTLPSVVATVLNLMSFTIETGVMFAITSVTWSLSDVTNQSNYVFSIFANGTDLLHSRAGANNLAGLPSPNNVPYYFGAEDTERQKFDSGTRFDVVVRALNPLSTSVTVGVSLAGVLYSKG